MSDKEIYDSYEEAIEAAMAYEDSLPEITQPMNYTIIVSHYCRPEIVELDDGDFGETGNFVVGLTVAWKARINGKQYGNYIIQSPGAPLEPALQVLDKNYHATCAYLEHEGDL